MPSLILFFLSIAAIFFNDVFAIDSSQLGFFLVLLIPLLLFLLTKIENKRLFIPVKESIFYLIFIIFSAISTFRAIDKEMSIQFLSIYMTGYLFFIYGFNYRDSLNKYFKWFLIGISIISVLIFSINKIFTLKLFDNGASLFYGGYYHNELGTVLILGIIICLYKFIFEKSNKLLILLLFFSSFLIFSFSRSAYLAVIIIGVIFCLIKKSWLPITLVILMTCLFFVTTKEINNFFPTSVKKFMVNKLLLPKEKSFTGKRQQHIYYALLSIKDRPFFGYGPGNLYFSTLKKQFNWEEGTTTAHNILLDIFAENGALAGVGFLLFLFYVFKNTKKDLYFYLLSSLTIVFLFDFSYRYTSIFIIWMILVGISLPKNQDKTEINSMVVLILMGIMFVFGQIVLMGELFYKIGLTDLSLRLYPLNNEAYTKIISGNIEKKEIKKGLKNLTEYNSLYKENLLNTAEFYEKLGDKKNAVYSYERAIYDKPLLISTVLTKIMILNVDLYGENAGKSETTKFINEFKRKVNIPKKSDVEKIIQEFCYDYKLKCQ